MANTATFEVSADRDKVADYLSEPRNVVVANHEGPVVERSDGPTRTGSWSILAFDQLCVRVEYTWFEPPDHVAVAMTFTGRGARDMSSTAVYRLLPIGGAGGTQVTVDAGGTGGVIARAFNRMTW